jgi:hypothetical protein
VIWCSTCRPTAADGQRPPRIVGSAPHRWPKASAATWEAATPARITDTYFGACRLHTASDTTYRLDLAPSSAPSPASQSRTRPMTRRRRDRRAFRPRWCCRA